MGYQPRLIELDFVVTLRAFSCCMYVCMYVRMHVVALFISLPCPQLTTV